MDIQRNLSSKRRRRRLLLAGAGGLVLIGATLGVASLEPAAPHVEGQALWIATVERGEMLRQVRGPGTLVPESVQWVSASSSGQVERILARPGTPVTAQTAVVELSNPELEQAALEAEAELRAAEADFRVLQSDLESGALSQESVFAAVAAEHNQADLQAAADERLAAEGLLPELTAELSRLRAAELAKRSAIEKERLAKTARSAEARLEAERSRLERLRALDRLQREKVRGLRVVAGMDGVLQQVDVEEGQRVAPGDILAQVAEPGRLKARLGIPEVQARDLLVGQKAEIDTRLGLVAGRVARIDPAVRHGAVTVEVTFDGPLPKGARPDLSVDGTIEIERLENVLFVGRPAYGQPGQPISLFKVAGDGHQAHRVTVELGRASVNTVEIVAGLEAGDRVVLSDVSDWDGYDRLRLN